MEKDEGCAAGKAGSIDVESGGGAPPRLARSGRRHSQGGQHHDPDYILNINLFVI